MEHLTSKLAERLTVLIILINIAAGVFIVDDFGMSWDMPAELEHGAYTLEYISQNTPFNPGQYSMGELNYYGSVFVTTAEASARVLQNFWPQLPRLVVYYGLNFLLFQLSAFFFFRLARRYMSQEVALVVTIVYATQPIFFGHAFINVKDLPLMSMFLISISAGLEIIDRIAAPESRKITWKDFPETLETIKREWDAASPGLKNKSKLAAFILVGFLVLTLVFWQPLTNLIDTTISSAYLSGDQTFIGRLFLRIAENPSEVSIENYIAKGIILFQRTITFGLGLALLGLLVFLIRKFPMSSKRLWEVSLKSYFEGVDRSFPKQVLGSFTNPLIVFAGILAGLAGAVRVTGLASWGLIVVLGILFRKGKSLALLSAYSVAALLTTWLAWPFLWYGKLPGFIRSLKTMSRFPLRLSVLVDGEYYSSQELPVGYLLKLLPIQFTEPVVVGFFLGLVVFLLLIWKKKISGSYAALLAFWFFLPVGYILISTPTMFDNFRHMLFLLPPLIVLFGIGFEWLTSSINRQWVSVGLSALVILPGIVALINSHPYQYVYYNWFTGGVSGANQRYELDYWGTSYREGIEYINQAADPGATIVVWGPLVLASQYARPDLELVPLSEFIEDENPFYFLVLVRYNAETTYYPELPVVFAVEHTGVPLAIVRFSE